MAVISNRILYQALVEEGFEIPKSSREIRVIVGIDGGVGLQFECFFDHEEMIKFGRVLQRIGQKEQDVIAKRAAAKQPS